MKNIGEYIEDCMQYMRIAGNKFKKEKDVEEALLTYVAGLSLGTIIKNQVDSDSPNDKKVDNYTIDLVIKASDGYLPIEIKHSVSATEPEMQDDLEKLEFYVQHYSDMPLGMQVYYSDKEFDSLTIGLVSIPNIIDKKVNFFYKLVYKGNYVHDESKAISFDDRWEAKEMK